MKKLLILIISFSIIKMQAINMSEAIANAKQINDGLEHLGNPIARELAKTIQNCTEALENRDISKIDKFCPVEGNQKVNQSFEDLINNERLGVVERRIMAEFKLREHWANLKNALSA